MELKTIGLTKKFGSKTAVNDLNITLSNGVYGLLGANGAGKTTFMRLLCNIQNPTSGKVLLNGKNIVGLGEQYRNLLGYGQSRYRSSSWELVYLFLEEHLLNIKFHK